MKKIEMSLDALARIDWNHVSRLPWHLDIEEEPVKKHGIDYWNEKAKTIYEGEEYFSDRAMAFLNTARIPDGATVLDVACGIGALTIPLLKKGCRVTAVDVSDYSLDVLKKNNGFSKRNLKLVHGHFRNVAADLEPCDYVINFYSLGLIGFDKAGKMDMSDALIKLNALALKKVVITMPPNDERDISDVHVNSYYWLLFGALMALGIVPSLRFKWFKDVGTLGFLSWKPVEL